MGGGAIRAAAKVAVFPAASGIRGMTAERYSISPVSRMAASGRPSAAAAAAGDVKLVPSSSDAGPQKPCPVLEDWVFPVVEGMGIDDRATDPMPRVVFGGLPTLQEAKEATSELSVALDKAFLSSQNSVGYGEGSIGETSLPLLNKQDIVTKACVTSDTVAAPAAIMAFKFLHESSMAKDAVASIACDPTVWKAVLENQELKNFLESQRACVVSPGKNSTVDSVADYDAKSADDSSEYEEPEKSNGFRNFFKKMKCNIDEMLSSLADYFQGLFGGKGESKSWDAVMERSFMGLAVMAILVILLKRA